MNNSISVIIPFYKADQFFDECINSILGQTVPVDEIIIVNDNSGDDSVRYLSKFNNHELIKIIHLNISHGASGARNIGLKEAKNEWIAFQDADDIWALNKIEKQRQYMLDNEGWDACHTGVLTFSEASKSIKTYIDKPSPMTLKELVKSSHITPPSLLVKKSSIESVGNFDTNFKTSGDYELSIRLVDSGLIIGFIPEPLIKVRRSNHGNISSNGFRTFKHHCKLVKKHRRIFVNYAGVNGIIFFLSKSIQESAGKIGGLRGALVYRIGKVLGYLSKLYIK